MQWKSSLIDSIFLPLEAQRIKAIRLYQPSHEDSLVWVGTQLEVHINYRWRRNKLKLVRQVIRIGMVLFGRVYGESLFPTK